MYQHLDHRNLVLASEDKLLPLLQSAKPDQTQNSSPMNKHRNYIYQELLSFLDDMILYYSLWMLQASAVVYLNLTDFSAR